MTIEPERLQVTIKQAAMMLNYSEREIYNMLARRELQSVGTGRKRRIPISELERWQKGQLHGQATRKSRG